MTQYLWNHLRPVIVKKNSQALSSDALSPFQKEPIIKQQDTTEIELATKRLLEEVIPLFIEKELVHNFGENKYMDKSLLLVVLQRMHIYGINFRFFHLVLPW